VKYRDRLTFGQRLADSVAAGMGSWKFIIIQSIIVFIWVTLNLLAGIYGWDPYPFILLNLLFSTQAAYAAPIIMMSQNRQSQRDRENAENDYEVNIASKKEIEEIIIKLNSIELDKLDRIVILLEEIKNKENNVEEHNKSNGTML